MIQTKLTFQRNITITWPLILFILDTPSEKRLLCNIIENILLSTELFKEAVSAKRKCDCTHLGGKKKVPKVLAFFSFISLQIPLNLLIQLHVSSIIYIAYANFPAGSGCSGYFPQQSVRGFSLLFYATNPCNAT